MTFAKSPNDVPDLDRFLSMSGLDYMQGIKNGTLPAPAMWATVGCSLHAVKEGQIVLQAAPAFAHTNPAGAVHGGWYGTLLDSCMSCAVMTKTPKGAVYTTLEYKVNLIRAIPLGAVILATGTVDHSGRSTGVAHGTITDAKNGKLYATGSATCLIMTHRAG